MTLHLPPAPAIAVKGDERRLRQCVVNLLANAIKLAPRGEVTVSAVADADGIEIRIAAPAAEFRPISSSRCFSPSTRWRTSSAAPPTSPALGCR
jgi:C4-dicarboxylate-specific signal transduction histidine kinase